MVAPIVAVPAAAALAGGGAAGGVQNFVDNTLGWGDV